MRKQFAAFATITTLIGCSWFNLCRADDGNQEIYSIAKTVPIGGDGGWDYVNIDPARQLLYVPRAKVVQVIDIAAGKVVAEIPGFTRPHGVALIPDAHRAFVSDGTNASVTIFDTTTNAVLGKIKTVADSDGIIYDSASDKVLVVSGDGNSLLSFPSSINPATGKVDTLDLGGAPEYLAADGQGRAFINLQDKDQVAVVDTRGMKILAKWPTAPGGAPTGMSIDREKHQLFIGCRKPAKMVVMDADTGKVLADLPIGAGVDATVVDGPYALASCGDGTLTVVQETSPGHYEVVQDLKTALGARTMVADNGTIYLVTADMKPAADGGRPRAVPNTFKIIVVSRTAATTKP